VLCPARVVHDNGIFSNEGLGVVACVNDLFQIGSRREMAQKR
jgi:hypothetical protein